MLVFINNNFFFLSANIIGLWASYHTEKLHRSNFLQHQTIREENIRIVNLIDLLHQKNEEIVAQGTEIEAQREILSIQNNELHDINATKDKFFSIIAHDLKNSFNSILAYSSLLVEELPETGSDRLTKSVATINSSAQNAFKLLENLLTWARTQTGAIEFRQESIRLKILLETAIDISENVAMNKGISLSLESDEELIVNADRNMVNTILRNLISNAIKYTHRGGKIVVKAISQNDLAKISIIDNGVGIAPDILEKLFKISEKISTPGTEKEPGTGLGLVLCKEFVEKHDGQLQVSSELGKGSEFFFGLPLVMS